MEKFGTFDSSEKAVPAIGDRWRPQTAEEEGDTISETFFFALCTEETY